MLRMLENLSYKDRLSELVLFSLKKIRLQADLICSLSVLESSL